MFKVNNKDTRTTPLVYPTIPSLYPADKVIFTATITIISVELSSNLLVCPGTSLFYQLRNRFLADVNELIQPVRAALKVHKIFRKTVVMEYFLSKVRDLETEKIRASAMRGIFQDTLSVENFRAIASFSCAV